MIVDISLVLSVHVDSDGLGISGVLPLHLSQTTRHTRELVQY